MKKTLILAAVAVIALSACSKNEILETINKVPEEAAIGFSNYTPNTLTKAGASYVNTTSLVANQKFAVMAYSTANATAFTTTAIGTSFMDKVAVKWVNNSNNGANNPYAPIRYWPSGDTPDWLTFWAYYPVVEAAAGGVAENTVVANNGIVYTAPNGSNGIGSFAFEAADAAANMVDFMVSDVVNDKIYGTTTGAHVAQYGEVPFIFHHMLTRVQFYFRTDKKDSDAYTDVVLKTVTLSDAYTKGTVTTAYSNGSTTRTWGSQAEHDTPIAYEVVNSTDGSFKLQEAKVMTPSKVEVSLNGSSPSFTYPSGYATTLYTDKDNVYLMVPQNLAASDPTITITYDIKTYNSTSDHSDGNLLSSSQNSATIHLKDVYKTGDSAKIQAWVENNIVTYTFIIGMHPVQFTATVVDWTPDIQGEINTNEL